MWRQMDRYQREKERDGKSDAASDHDFSGHTPGVVGCDTSFGWLLHEYGGCSLTLVA